MAIKSYARTQVRTFTQKRYSGYKNPVYCNAGFAHLVCPVKDIPQCEELNTTINVVTTLASVVTDSVSSPGFYSTKTRIVKWIPKKYPLVPPVAPTYRPPKLPKEPKWSKSHRRLAKQKLDYDLLLNKMTELRRAYNISFANRVVKFEKRYARYLELSRLQANGIVRKKRVKAKAYTNTFNAYSRTTTIDNGHQGRIDTWLKYWAPLCPTHGVARGPSAYNISSTGYRMIHWLDVGSFPSSYGYDSFYDAFPEQKATIAAESSAKTNFYTALKDESVHVGNIIAERHQTFSLISDIAKRLAAIISLKKHALNNVTSGQLANDVLAFQFGVKPLLNDAYQAGKALARHSTSGNEIIEVRGVGNGTDRKYAKWNRQTSEIFHRNVTVTCKVSYVCEYRIINGTLDTLNKLGLINPAEIAWEVIPWSFAIDWFLPLGNYISSLSASAGLEFIRGTKTVTTTTTYDNFVVYKTDPTTAYDKDGYVHGSKSVETKVRTVLTSPPDLELPVFKNPYSLNHLIDALALLRQKL